VQALQAAAEVMPGVPKVPVGQGVDPVPEHQLPRGQLTGAAVPPAQKEPGGHTVPEEDTLPAGQ